MSLYLILKLLHIVSVIGMIAGLIGRNIVKARTAKVSDIQIMQAFVELGGRFERYLLIPDSLFVLLTGLLLAWAGRWSFQDGLLSTSAMATQFLQERMLAPCEVVREGSASKTRGNERTVSIAALTEPSQAVSSRNPLEKRRDELERGAGGNHDLPYRFTLPTSMPQVLAWVKLLVKVQQGDLQSEVVAFGSGNSNICARWG